VILKTTELAAAFLLFLAVVWGRLGRRCHGSDARRSGNARGLAGNPRLSGQSVAALLGSGKRRDVAVGWHVL